MNKICTTIKQSKELIELGIDIFTSDRFYSRDREDELPIIPAWSLSALLELLPSATLDISDNHGYRIHCRGKFTEWHVTAVDAAVAMIKRLKEQNEL